MKESDYFRALGVEPRNVAQEKEPAAKQQEAVEPAKEPETITETESDNKEVIVEPPTDAEEEVLPPQSGKPQMSKEERARQAKARRQRELDAAIEKARQEEQEKNKQEMDRLIKRLNLRDSANGNKPIETVEDFEAWEEKRNDEKLERELKAGKLTRQSLEAMIENNPAIKAVRQAQQQQQASAQPASDVIAAELAEIQKLDPAMKSLQIICESENGDKFRELVTRYNMSFIDAFKIANFERLQTVRQAAATQAAINNQASKNHLSSVASPANNAVIVPDAVYKNYKAFCPWMSEDEIRKDYANRTRSAKKG